MTSGETVPFLSHPADGPGASHFGVYKRGTGNTGAAPPPKGRGRVGSIVRTALLYLGGDEGNSVSSRRRASEVALGADLLDGAEGDQEQPAGQDHSEAAKRRRASRIMLRKLAVSQFEFRTLKNLR
jgi:hypothetical protein